MSWISRLFKSNDAQPTADFHNPITTEIHSHLIPAIDDGVETLEQSIEVLQSFSALGYTKVITTPHIMGDFYKNGKHNILPGLDRVREELELRKIPIQLEAAAEYMVDDSLQKKIDENNLLTFGNKCVLIELPFQSEPPNFKKIVFDLQLNGYQPVLAHPERYSYMALKKDRYNELHDAGIWLQLNLFSMVGYYSPEVKKTAEYLIDQRIVKMVGSDIHGPRHIPVLQAALTCEAYQKLCNTNTLINQAL